MTKRVAWMLVFVGSIVTACSYTVPTTVTETNICGDGVIGADEACDDGNTIDGDGCDSNCTATACGNGIVTADEQCDDGNDKNGDGCTKKCLISICGDGNKQIGEECDDGNRETGDACDSNCTMPRCGNGVKGPNEVCDDGNVENGDACNPSCSLTNHTSIFIGAVGVLGYADGIGEAAQLSDRPLMVIHGGTMFTSGANTVRMVDLVSRQVTTIAGSGGVVGNADNQNGLMAQFGSIDGIATDGTTLWVADADNHLLRAVSLTPPYAVSTVAGLYAAPGTVVTSKDGVGLTAQFDTLRGLLYYEGLVYMLDGNANILQTFNPSTTEVKTVAGSPYQISVVDGIGINARFGGPRLMTSNGAGLFYISDSDGRSIRAFDVATTAVTTLVGSSACGYVEGFGASAALNRPRGITTDGSSLYFAEPQGQTIRQIVLETQQVTTLSGTPIACAFDCSCQFGTPGSYAEGVGKAAQWNIPWDVVFDPSSKSLFVSDSKDYVIRRIQ